MPITTLPTPPTRSDPFNFNSRADAFLAALPTFALEANALQSDVNAKQSAAATSATNAAASELAAGAVAGATIWVSGTTYAIGNTRFSPITFLTYRRKTAGAGTTDPSADSTNWQLINGTGNVDLTSVQTLTNKTFSTGSVWNGSAVPVVNGGTGSTTQGAAQTALDVPSRSGSGASGLWNINITGTSNTVTTITTAQVIAATAGATTGAVGTYALLALFPSSTVGPAQGAGGSDLRFASASGLLSSAPAGTWLCMGAAFAGGSYADRTSLWLRIA